MSDQATSHSRWRRLIEEWSERERKLHPDAPVRSDSIRVRDAVEIGDQTFVLVSYDVEVPWPTEEDTAAEGRDENAAVLLVERVSEPWIERDAARAFGFLRTADGSATLHEHLLGPRRVYSGTVTRDAERVAIKLDDGSKIEADVIEGWLLAVLPDDRHATEITALDNGDESWTARLEPDHVHDLLDESSFTRTAGRAMYFSPLDLRGVFGFVQWERADGMFVAATCLEQYDDGGVVRLRIDGIRGDDDILVSWPNVGLAVDGQPVAGAICGESTFSDTLALDVGFRPWIPAGSKQLTVVVRDLRGHRGPVSEIAVNIDLTSLSGLQNS